MSATPFTAPPYVAPDGPRWVPGAQRGDTQTDGRGVRWFCEQVEQGGRVLHWRASGTLRMARTEVTPAHPAYPSDEAVVAQQRAERAARKAARR